MNDVSNAFKNVPKEKIRLLEARLTAPSPNSRVRFLNFFFFEKETTSTTTLTKNARAERERHEIFGFTGYVNY
jgi:hypothetical protein